MASNAELLALTALAVKQSRAAFNRPMPPPPDEGAIMRAIMAQLPRVDFDGLKRDVWAWLEAQDFKGADGRAPTEAEIAAAVIEYVNTLDLKGDKGDSVTPDQVMSAVELLLPELFAAVADDLRGEDGKDADPVTDEQISAAVVAYLATQDLKGEKGDSPTADELNALIAEQVARIELPKPKDGKTPSKSELTAIVRDVLRTIELPKGEDGKTPTEAEILPIVVRVVGQMDLVGPQGTGIDRITQPRKTIMRVHLTDGTHYDVDLPRPVVTGGYGIAKGDKGDKGDPGASVLGPLNVRYVSANTTTTNDDDIVIVQDTATVTLHNAGAQAGAKAIRIKRVGAGDVTVQTVDGDGYILNVNYQAVDCQWTGSEWISL